jgi:hypothetical protein
MVTVSALVGSAWSLSPTRAATTRSAAREPSAPRASVELHVPRAPAPIAITGEVEGKAAWEADSGSTRNFADATGKGMVPYTEAKLRWTERTLYVLLYAGDLDLEGTVTEADGALAKDDSFHLELGDPARVIDVSVLGTVSDAICSANGACDAAWTSGAVVAVDRDGTLNRTGDNDEEWVVEMAVPFDALAMPAAGPGTRLPLAVRRCDVGRDGPHACGGWRGELVLDP